MTVAEAARVLGLTPDAVRMRLKRGALVGKKGGAEWVVWLPDDSPTTEQATEHHRTTPEQTTERTTEQPGPSWSLLVASKDETIAYLAAENEYLREQLAERSRELADERERSDTLQQIALNRIEALTAGVIPESEEPRRTSPQPVADEDFSDGDDGLQTEGASAGLGQNAPEATKTAPGATGAMSSSPFSNLGPSEPRETRRPSWWRRLLYGG